MDRPELTPTAREMLESGPDYYWGNPFLERLVLGAANAIDRLEARALAVRDALIPNPGPDPFGLRAAWETVVGLPPAPDGATDAQRHSKIAARLQTMGDGSANTTVEALRQAGGNQINVLINTPVPLVDTLEMPYDPDTYNAAQVEALAERIWPAHRDLVMHYSQGFLLDASRLDSDSL